MVLFSPFERQTRNCTFPLQVFHGAHHDRKLRYEKNISSGMFINYLCFAWHIFRKFRSKKLEDVRGNSKFIVTQHANPPHRVLFCTYGKVVARAKCCHLNHRSTAPDGKKERSIKHAKSFHRLRRCMLVLMTLYMQEKH
jgi:hypothetical protein